MKKLLLFAILVLGLGSLQAGGWRMEETGSSTPWMLEETGSSTPWMLEDADTPTYNNDWALTYR